MVSSDPTSAASDLAPAEPDRVDDVLGRRRFLTKLWLTGGGLVAAAGAWTGWDLLRPLPATGFGGIVRSVPSTSVPESGVVEVPAARAYLTRLDDQILALSQKCTHLGCRVPYCESSGQFECPCHGSVFNRVGDYVAGPAPRGMDRYAVEVGDDGLVLVDTGTTENGPEPGILNVDEPARGPSCASRGPQLMAYGRRRGARAFDEPGDGARSRAALRDGAVVPVVPLRGAEESRSLA